MHAFDLLRTTLRKLIEMILDIVIPLHPDDQAIRHLAPVDIQKALTNASHRDDDLLVATTLSIPVVRALMHGLKYRKRKEYAVYMGHAAYHVLQEYLADTLTDGSWIIVPVPASSVGLRERGYNQSELIARVITKESGERMNTLPLLKRTDRRPAQTTAKSATARTHNMNGAFVATLPPHLKAAHFIVIDDVRTTGATLKEAKRALKEAGGHHILLLAVAQAPLKGH